MESQDQIYRQLQIHYDKYPIGFPATKSGVEIRVLKHFFTPNDARIALCMGIMEDSIPTIYRRVKKLIPNLTLEELEKRLEQLYIQGNFFQIIKKGKKYYSNAFLAIGIFEFHVDHFTETMVRDIDQYLYESFGKEMFRTGIPQLRTIPLSIAITLEHHIANYDDMRAYLRNTNLLIGVANCACKQSKDLLHQPCKVSKLREVCLILGTAEQDYRNRGQSRQVTKEEAIQILNDAEKEGLVLQALNTLEPMNICCCCGCCCGIINAAKTFPKPAEVFWSNYYAIIDTQQCKNCGICKKRCPMDAPQKLEKTYAINRDSCIGCGVCVSTCPSKTVHLVKKQKSIVPPNNVIELYVKILLRKTPKLKLIGMLVKKLLGAPL